MKFKLIFFIILLTGSVFFRFSNMNRILHLNRENRSLMTVYNAESALYNQLLEINQKLSSRERITKIAYEELGMVLPVENEKTKIVYVKEKPERSSVGFKLLDYLTPTVEAITRSQPY